MQTEGQGRYSNRQVRRSAQRYLAGRGANALLVFIAFLLIARLLPKIEYGYYIAALVAFELVMYLSSLGIEWVGGIYIPQYRINAPGRPLNRFVGLLVGAQMAALALGGALLASLSVPLSELLGVSDASSAIAIYGAVAFVEGSSRMLRDQLLGALLEQGAAQLCQLVRNLLFCTSLGYLVVTAADANAVTVATLELLAAAASLAAGTWAVFAALGKAAREMPPAPQQNWQPPAFDQLVGMARAAYAGTLGSIAYGPQILTMLVTRYAGPEGAAAYGFARNLADQASRYMPVTLFLGIARPVLSARYAATGESYRLADSLNLYAKANLAFLVPILALFIACGELAIHVLGAGKFDEAAVVTGLLLSALVPAGLRILMDVMAHLTRRSHLCLHAALPLVALPFLAIVFLKAGAGIEGAALVALLAPLSYGAIIATGLARTQPAYRLPFASVLRGALAVLLAATVLFILPLPTGPSGLGMAAALALVLSIPALWATRFFSRADIEALRGLLGWR